MKTLSTASTPRDPDGGYRPADRRSRTILYVSFGMPSMICDEMWNSVCVYGPQSEIDRFKRACIVPDTKKDWERAQEIGIDWMVDPDGEYEDDLMLEAEDVCCDSWNFRQSKGQKPGIYWFAFDTSPPFPTWLLERFAATFPKLAFDCDCIADNDEAMGFGWFNTPSGGEGFHDGYDVPEGYWEKGRPKRDPVAHLRYLALVERMKGAAEEASRR